MISEINILGYRIAFVFRHKFEKETGRINSILYWRDYRIGLWFKTYKKVSKPKDGPAIIGKGGTHSNSYMFGVDLIICKFWIDICYRPLILSLDEKDK